METTLLKQAAVIALGYGALLFVIKKLNDKAVNKRSSSMDGEGDSCATGMVDCLVAFGPCPTKKKPGKVYKPETWVQVGDMWVWVNEKGNLTISR